MGMNTLNEFDVVKMEREVSKSHPNEKSQPKVELPKTTLEGLVEVDYNGLLKYINLSQEGVEIKPVNYMNRKIVFNKGDYHVENLDQHDDNWRVNCDWKELKDGRKVITIKVLHESKKDREMVDDSDVTDRYEFLYNLLMAQKVASMITALVIYPDLRRCMD